MIFVRADVGRAAPGHRLNRSSPFYGPERNAVASKLTPWMRLASSTLSSRREAIAPGARLVFIPLFIFSHSIIIYFVYRVPFRCAHHMPSLRDACRNGGIELKLNKKLPKLTRKIYSDYGLTQVHCVLIQFGGFCRSRKLQGRNW